MLDRDGQACQIKGAKCTRRATEVDHIVSPRAGGAFFDPANLRAACEWCNRSRAQHQRGGGWQTAGTRITKAPPGAIIDGPLIDRAELISACNDEILGRVAYRLLVEAMTRGELRVDRVTIIDRDGDPLPSHDQVDAEGTNLPPPPRRSSRNWTGD